MNIRRPPHLRTPFVVAIPVVCLSSVAIASDMELSLQVKSRRQQVYTERTDELPSVAKPHPRPVFTSDGHETLVVSWKATNVGEQDTFENVLIHCFVVLEEKSGQLTVPSLEDPLHESALTMDFKPGSSAAGEFSLTIDKPGAYLVRVETRNMLDKHGHEHYAALDLVRE